LYSKSVTREWEDNATGTRWTGVREKKKGKGLGKGTYGKSCDELGVKHRKKFARHSEGSVPEKKRTSEKKKKKAERKNIRPQRGGESALRGSKAEKGGTRN